MTASGLGAITEIGKPELESASVLETKVGGMIGSLDVRLGMLSLTSLLAAVVIRSDSIKAVTLSSGAMIGEPWIEVTMGTMLCDRKNALRVLAMVTTIGVGMIAWLDVTIARSAVRLWW